MEEGKLKEKIEMLEKFIREEGDHSRGNLQSLNFKIREKESEIRLLAHDLEKTKQELNYAERGWNEDRSRFYDMEQEYRARIKRL